MLVPFSSQQGNNLEVCIEKYPCVIFMKRAMLKVQEDIDRALSNADEALEIELSEGGY